VRFIYLHGFASSPDSRKAQAFRLALERRGIDLEIPSLDEGDFEHLTISRQLTVVDRTVAREQVCLIGSSMGGYLASLYAAEHAEISKLVLLAPAFGFAERWRDRAKQLSGNAAPPAFFEVFHYGENRMRRVHSGLVEDALTFPPAPDFSQMALIFHGVYDDTVPIENSRSFAAAHANVRLIELDSDHELLNTLDRITDEAVPFLLSQLR
jgi:pimeloyl-ACP methyl ester carboxylesterase